MPLHNYNVGQSLLFVPGKFEPKGSHGTYTVLRLLPNDAADREYRVRNDRDGHERVVKESQLRERPAMDEAAPLAAQA